MIRRSTLYALASALADPDHPERAGAVHDALLAIADIWPRVPAPKGGDAP